MLGNLVISPQSAHITHTTKRFSLMDPFVRVIIGNQMQDSNVAKNFHKDPYWRSELTFVCPNDQVINFEIWDKCKMGKDKLIGSSSFTLSALGDRNFFFDWLPLYYKDKQAGQFLVWLHFYPTEQHNMGSQYPMSQTSMIQQPTSMQTMMPMSMQPQMMMGGMNSMPMDSGMGSMSGNPMMSNATLGSTRMVNYSSTNPPDKNITVVNNDRVQYMERPVSREMNSGMGSIDRDHSHFQGHDHFHTSSMADSEMRHMGSENRSMMGMRPFNSGMTSGMDSMPMTHEGMSTMPMQGMRPMGTESRGMMGMTSGMDSMPMTHEGMSSMPMQGMRPMGSESRNMMGMTSPRGGDYGMMSSMPNMSSQRMGGDMMGMNSAGMTSMPMSSQTMGRGMDYMDSNPGMGRDMMMGMHSRNETMPGSHGKLSSMMRSMRTDAKEMLGMDSSRRPYSSGMGHERMSSMPVSGMGYMGSGNRNMMGMRPLSSGMTSGMDSMPKTQEGMSTMPMQGMRPIGTETRGMMGMESRGGNYPSMMNSMPMMSNTGMSRDSMSMNPMGMQSGMDSMPQGGMSSMSTMGSSNREMQGMRPSSFKTMGSNLQSDPYRNFSSDMMGNMGMRPMSRDAQSVISSIPYDSGMNSGIGSLNSLGGNSSMGNQNQMGSNSGMGMMSSNIPFTTSMLYKPNVGTSNMISSFNPSNMRKTNLVSNSMFPSSQRGTQVGNEGGYGDGSGLDKIISNLDSDRFNSGKYSKMPGAGKETMEASGEMLSGYAMGGPAMTGPMLGSEMKTDKLSAASMQDQRRPYSY